MEICPVRGSVIDVDRQTDGTMKLVGAFHNFECA